MTLVSFCRDPFLGKTFIWMSFRPAQEASVTESLQKRISRAKEAGIQGREVNPLYWSQECTHSSLIAIEHPLTRGENRSEGRMCWSPWGQRWRRLRCLVHVTPSLQRHTALLSFTWFMITRHSSKMASWLIICVLITCSLYLNYAPTFQIKTG